MHDSQGNVTKGRKGKIRKEAFSGEPELAEGHCRIERSESKVSLAEKEWKRFWNGVQIGSQTECWPWIKGHDRYGYGVTSISQKLIKAHRLSYMIHYGLVPQDKPCVCHSCDNPSCCNPAHLWVGTQTDNQNDKKAKGRFNPAIGDRNGSRTHPESRAQGERHGTKTHPERIARGKHHGWALHPEAILRGEDAGMSKLTEAIVREMRRRYKDDGIGMYALGRIYGVAGATARRAIVGGSWRHVV